MNPFHALKLTTRQLQMLDIRLEKGLGTQRRTGTRRQTTAASGPRLGNPIRIYFLHHQSLPLELSILRNEEPTLSYPPDYVALAPKRKDFWEISADGVAFSHFGCFSLVAEPSAEDYVAVVETQCHLKELQMLHAVKGTETHRLLEDIRRLAGQKDCGDLIRDLIEGLESQQVCVFKGLDTGFRVPEGDGYFWGVTKARDGQTKLAIDIFIASSAK